MDYMVLRCGLTGSYTGMQLPRSMSLLGGWGRGGGKILIIIIPSPGGDAPRVYLSHLEVGYILSEDETPKSRIYSVANYICGDWCPLASDMLHVGGHLCIRASDFKCM